MMGGGGRSLCESSTPPFAEVVRSLASVTAGSPVPSLFGLKTDLILLTNLDMGRYFFRGYELRIQEACALDFMLLGREHVVRDVMIVAERANCHWRKAC